jgi:hypothetical protein
MGLVGRGGFEPPTNGLRVASGVRQTHARSAALHGDDAGLSQIRLVLGDNTCANPRLIKIAKIDKAHDSGMGSTERNRKLAEILVERHEYLAVPRRMGENLVVTGSVLQSPTHSTSCPTRSSSAFAPGQMQLSSRSFRLPRR